MEQGQNLEAIMAELRSRRMDKTEVDHERDVKLRTLVGARLPRETAEQVRAAAAARGVSVYRWVADAIQRELRR